MTEKGGSSRRMIDKYYMYFYFSIKVSVYLSFCGVFLEKGKKARKTTFEIFWR